MRIVKIIGIVLAAMIGLVLLAMAILLLVVDPNDYKSQISALVYDASGYHLTLDGDLSWSFYPVLGFGSEDVSLSADPKKTAFVELAGLSVGVQLLPLFSKQLKVDSLNLSGLKAHLQVDEQGVQNWQPVSISNTQQPAVAQGPDNKADETAAQQANPLLADLEIPLIRVQDSDIRYQDRQAGGNYALHVKLLQLEHVRLDQPFDLSLQMTADAGEGLVVQLDGSSKVALDLNQSRYSLSNFKLALEVAGIADKPLPVQLEAAAVVDLKADTAQLSLTKLKLEEQAIQAQIEVTQLQTDPAFSARIQLPASDIKPLLSKLAIQLPEMASSTALSKVGLDATIKGTPRALTIQPLNLTLDESKLSGLLALDDIEKQALRFDLQLDRINLDHYLPPVREEDDNAVTPPPTGNTPATGSEELIPVELLRTLNLAGQLRITQLQAQQIPLHNLLVKVEAKSGVVKVAPMALEVFSGKIAGNVVVDAKKATPDLTADLNVENLETAGVVKHFADLDVLSGRVSLNLNTKAQGNTVDVLKREAIGQLKFQLQDGVLHGININNLVVDALSDQIASLERFYPEYKKYVPRELKQDTDIKSLVADARIENGKLIMPNFNFAIDNGAIDANGNFDLINLGFDFQMGVYLKAMDQVKYLKGVKWPVQCKGNLELAPADWCRPDTAQIKKVMSAASKSAFKDEAAKELGDKLGVDAQSKQQLESELKAKAKEEEDRAKKKLENQLDKFFKKL